ncbi:zinc-binding dehydrogenase [Microbispora sp. H13382]|uniref:zinc-dependent alcohol dehydrogenase family protein n=1 Tax=Microbispora sp. H13382 TaxID=2729112 RepID=UPI00160312C6|nr:zinc-binding dehydrogenase [Microbispora sp. H13382]
MRGVVFPGSSVIGFIDLPDPTPGPGEVVVEIKASGMCGSDLNLYRAAPGSKRHPKLPPPTEPIIAGHEPCGVVAAVGSGVTANEARVGDRVMVHHYWGCSVCEHCRAGWAQMCSREVPAVYGISAHGAHAPYMTVPARTLVPLPEELSFEAGSAISCGMGTSYGALMRVRPSGRDTVAIYGQGPVGLAATQLAAAMGARVIALDISEERLRRAGELGADVIVNPAVESSVEAILQHTKGRGADYALETSGAVSARAEAIAAVRPWGAVVLVAGVTALQVENVSTITSRQLTIMGSWTFSNVGQAECAQFVVDHGIPVDELFSHRWRLDQAEEAYQLFARQTDGKGVFLFG